MSLLLLFYHALLFILSWNFSEVFLLYRSKCRLASQRSMAGDFVFTVHVYSLQVDIQQDREGAHHQDQLSAFGITTGFFFYMGRGKWTLIYLPLCCTREPSSVCVTTSASLLERIKHKKGRKGRGLSLYIIWVYIRKNRIYTIIYLFK